MNPLTRILAFILCVILAFIPAGIVAAIVGYLAITIPDYMELDRAMFAAGVVGLFVWYYATLFAMVLCGLIETPPPPEEY